MWPFFCTSDVLPLMECRGSSDEHKVLAELASAMVLTPVCETGLMDHLWEVIPVEIGLRNTVPIVLGGFKVSLAEMDEFKAILHRDLEAGKGSWKCYCNGNQVNVKKMNQNRV